MYKYVSLAAVAAIAVSVSFGATGITPAQAVTTTITVNDTLIEVDCVGGTDPVCQGYTGAGSPSFPAGPGVLSPDSADLYFLGNASLATETAALNELISGDPTDPFSTGAKTSVPEADQSNFSFLSTAGYIAFKIGLGQLAGNYFFLALSDPGEVQLIYSQNGQTQGGGFSHYTEFGSTVIPLPAGLVLFLSGLAGVGFLGRYKAKRREPALA